MFITRFDSHGFISEIFKPEPETKVFEIICQKAVGYSLVVSSCSGIYAFQKKCRSFLKPEMIYSVVVSMQPKISSKILRKTVDKQTG